MLNKLIDNFKYGTIDTIGDNNIPDGAASASVNFLTKGDKIELRRGMRILGTELTSGACTGLWTAFRADGTEILYRKRGRKLEYYNTATLDWVEVGTDIFPVAATNEDCAFANYSSTAGSQLWISSPNGGLWKIMTANPASVVDVYDSTKNYKGYIKMSRNRMRLWGRVQDKTGIYDSYIDKMTYTTVSAEVLGTGNGSTKAYSGTLAFKAGGAKRTCFGITVTDTVETFTDNFNGVLTGSLGGSGTINYATGAIAVTFNSNVNNAQSITVTYQWEDSTNNGVADFTFSPTRTAGQGLIVRQDDEGGSAMFVGAYNNSDYILHERRTWILTVGADDTTATNLIYRDKVGIQNWRGAVDTGSGIYFIDSKQSDAPQIRVLTLDGSIQQVVPVAISYNIKLTDYYFDKAAMFEYGDYILLSCRKLTNNDTIFVYNKVWKTFDKLVAYANNFTIYGGKLICGDSITGNVYEFLSGFSDGDQDVQASWEGNFSHLGYMGLKKVKRMVFEGEIQVSQKYDIYADLDHSGYIQVGSVSGSGTYIDKGQARSILGAEMIGADTIGGQGGTTVYHYQCEFKIKTDKFQYVKIKIVPTGTGYVSASMIIFEDIRRKSMKQPKKYRVAS